MPENQTTGPSSIQFPHARMESHDTKSNNVTWIVVAGLLIVVLLSLLTCLFLSRCCKRRPLDEETEKTHQVYAYANSHNDDSFQKPDDHQAGKGKILPQPYIYIFSIASIWPYNHDLMVCCD